MNDHIRYSSEALTAAAAQCEKLEGVLEDVAALLARVDTSEAWWTKTGAADKILAGKKNANAVAQKARDMSAAIGKAKATFEAAETAMIGRFSAESTGENTDIAMSAANLSVENSTVISSSFTFGLTKADYDLRVQNRRNNAIDREVARLYDRFKKKIHIGSDTQAGGAYYNPLLNRIYYNWQDDLKNKRGECSTYFHEVGHMVDDYTHWPGDSSSSKSFSTALKNDFENYVNNVMKQNSCSRDEAYDIIEDWLCTDGNNKNGVSDLVGGLTQNECVGYWLHNTSYWQGATEHGIPDKINNEAFAHFFEASMSTDATKLSYLREVFPNAYKEFKNIVRKANRSWWPI